MAKKAESILQKLQKELGIKNILALPNLQKVVVNVGLGRAVKDEKFLEVALRDLGLITGQKPKITLAKKSIANFKTREGAPIGAMVTLRGKRMYDFISRLINIALPRTRDFRGISAKSLDKNNNLTIGIKEHIVFPEVSGEEIKNIFGFEITLVIKAKNKDEAMASSLFLAFITNVISNPKIFLISSPETSGNTICSFIPIVKLLFLSSDLALMPRKSRVRGKAIFIRREIKSYILFPRKVTIAPIGTPSLVLKLAIDFLANVSFGFWPVIKPR